MTHGKWAASQNDQKIPKNHNLQLKNVIWQELFLHDYKESAALAWKMLQNPFST